MTPSYVSDASAVPLLVTLRTSIFRALFPAWTAIVCACCSPWLTLARRSEGIAFSGRIWAAGICFLLRHICGVRFRVEGTEHLPQNGAPCVIACRHESVWETAVFLYLMHHPTYVLKKELLDLPLFGRFLKKLEMIAVDRSAGGAAVRALQQDCITRLAEGRHIIIFPQGTRIPHTQEAKCQPGVAFIYASLPEDVPLIPVTLDSGKHWSSFRRAILPGTITLRYLPPLSKGMPRKALMAALDEHISRPAETPYLAEPVA